MALLRVRCLCTVFPSTNVRKVLKLITFSIKIHTQKVPIFRYTFKDEKVELFNHILAPWGAILEPKVSQRGGVFFCACSVFGPCAMVALWAPKVAPKVPQGSPRDPKRHPKGAPGSPKRHPEAAPGTLKAPRMIHFVIACC